MKKFISLALAVVMLLAVCVPAFAADTKKITNETVNSATTLVKTSKLKEDGTSGENFMVILPLDASIPWGKETATDMSYNVEAHLGYGKKLSVKVTGNYKMALTEDANETIDYTLGGTTEYLSGGPVVNPGVDVPFTLTVDKDTWANAIVGEYKDTLTFTAEVVLA